MSDAIKVVEITEHEDGSAHVSLDMDPEVYAKVFEYGFVELLKKGMKSDEEYNKTHDTRGT
tara:strand:- start:546 stop:728 length:183 start_codon:yes stop_codon:yes gene_type:complete